jgi:hypothetical protein
MKTFREFVETCEGYVPLRTSDQPYDDEGFPTRTRSWSKKMTNALMNVGKQKFNSSIGVGDAINNLVKGVSAKARLDSMKKVDAEPESVRAKRSQAKSQANQQLGANRRRLQTSMDRQHLDRSLKGMGAGNLIDVRPVDTSNDPYGTNQSAERRAQDKFNRRGLPGA